MFEHVGTLEVAWHSDSVVAVSLFPIPLGPQNANLNQPAQHLASLSARVRMRLMKQVKEKHEQVTTPTGAELLSIAPGS